MHARLSLTPAMLFLFLQAAGCMGADSVSTAALQDPADHGSTRTPVILSSANLVLVPVSVRDGSGNPVTNLQLEDFSVRDNGETVILQHLGEPELTQLEMALIFDVTSSLWAHFDFVKQAATGFVESLFRSGDAAAIVCITSEPEILLEPTESLPVVLDGLKRIQRFGAATAFFDAVVAAARLFPVRTDPETRRVIIVLSDGEDNLSTAGLENALEHVQKSNSVFYSINPGTSPTRLNKVSRRGQQWMETIADQTGGTAFLAESFNDLDLIYGRIAEELKVQYLLSYYSPAPPAAGGFRTITVTLPDRPELNVSARKGYYAGSTTPH